VKSLFLVLIISTYLGAWAQTSVPRNGPHLETDLIEKYEKDIEKKKLSAKDVQKRNRRTIKRMQELPLPSKEGGRVSISQNEANEIVQKMRLHPVVGNEALKIYDPEGCIGFCFGRATWAHLELIKRKVNPASTVKAFVVGSMVEGDSIWGWHVSDFVRSDDGEWRALDEATGAVTLQEWLDYWRAQDDSGKVRLYMTDPRKFTAETGAYEDSHMREFYDGYFIDMFQDEGIAAAYMKVQFPSAKPKERQRTDSPGLLCKEIFAN